MQCSCVSTPRWTDVLCGYCDAKTRFGVRAELPARAKCLHLRKTVEDYMRIYFTPMPGIGCGGVALKSVKLSLWQGKCGGRCLEQKRKTQAKTNKMYYDLRDLYWWPGYEVRHCDFVSSMSYYAIRLKPKHRNTQDSSASRNSEWNGEELAIGTSFTKLLKAAVEPLEIVERDVKKLKRRRIPLVKVRWNSRQGAEYTWEREDQFRIKYPNLSPNFVPSSKCRNLSLEDKAHLTGKDCAAESESEAGQPIRGAKCAHALVILTGSALPLNPKLLTRQRADIRWSIVEKHYGNQDTSTQSTSGGGSSSGVSRDPYARLLHGLNQHKKKKSRGDPTMSSEYEQYLKTDFVSGLQPKDFASYDVLGFWKSKENQFPVLSRMAMDILSVQASSVASESAFSTSGRLLTIRRTRLTPESLEMCMCLKDHLDAQERKQNTSPLELPLDVEEGVFNDEVQQNEATQLTDQEIALDASSDGSLSSGERRRDYMMSSGAEDDQTGEGGSMSHGYTYY
ncbi:zinc finger BED domain-containing protein RICESLEEPER 2 [Tanacetum coccineum]|uniref:Zinc finger BED domain-containing protein RICESLEEPER 2 n=2 Tax=Tanacetum coccineum TaxID=301880 RepID=A0ABQ4XLR4_9ASTR